VCVRVCVYMCVHAALGMCSVQTRTKHWKTLYACHAIPKTTLHHGGKRTHNNGLQRHYWKFHYKGHCGIVALKERSGLTSGSAGGYNLEGHSLECHSLGCYSHCPRYITICKSQASLQVPQDKMRQQAAEKEHQYLVENSVHGNVKSQGPEEDPGTGLFFNSFVIVSSSRDRFHLIRLVSGILCYPSVRNSDVITNGFFGPPSGEVLFFFLEKDDPDTSQIYMEMYKATHDNNSDVFDSPPPINNCELNTTLW